jgi:ubiquinone/menaquinone biosynthesis C-methylase UbiE
MPLSISQLHRRYQQQAEWTQNLRKYIYDCIGIQYSNKILDIGCGTGVLEDELNHLPSAHIFGLDIDFNALSIARNYAQKSIYTSGDCLKLPYPSGIFDVTLCHYLLLWIKEPLKAIQEMARVTQPHGYVVALAEPDYGGRIDFPQELSQIGTWQTEALKEQGANPYIGRELRSILSRAELEKIEAGVLGGQWREQIKDQEIELEWEVIQSDLHQVKEFIMHKDKFRGSDLASRKTHQRILFVPTFYAFGMVSS